MRRPFIIFIVSLIKSLEAVFKRQHFDSDFSLRELVIKVIWLHSTPEWSAGH